MDTSKKYIKMCKEAIEIQKLWKAKEGDFYFCECKDIPHYPEGYGNVVLTVGDADLESEDLYMSDTDTWLPRQDQLQEIKNWDKSLTAREVIETFYAFISFAQAEYYDNFTSMEQLWLAFVIAEKHDKFWNDKIKKWTEKHIKK